MKKVTISTAVRAIRAGDIVWNHASPRYAEGIEIDGHWRLSNRALRRQLLRFLRLTNSKGLYIR